MNDITAVFQCINIGTFYVHTLEGQDEGIWSACVYYV